MKQELSKSINEFHSLSVEDMSKLDIDKLNEFAKALGWNVTKRGNETLLKRLISRKNRGQSFLNYKS